MCLDVDDGENNRLISWVLDTHVPPPPPPPPPLTPGVLNGLKDDDEAAGVDDLLMED